LLCAMPTGANAYMFASRWRKSGSIGDNGVNRHDHSGPRHSRGIGSIDRAPAAHLRLHHGGTHARSLVLQKEVTARESWKSYPLHLFYVLRQPNTTR
jgi:hypothetical protein